MTSTWTDKLPAGDVRASIGNVLVRAVYGVDGYSVETPGFVHFYRFYALGWTSILQPARWDIEKGVFVGFPSEIAAFRCMLETGLRNQLGYPYDSLASCS